MMKRWAMGRALACLAAVLMVGAALPLRAQVTPYAGAQIGVLHGMGYNNPAYDFKLGVEESGKHFLLQQEGYVSTADKTENNTGTQINLQARGYWRREAGAITWLAGGGVRASRMYTSQWQKDAIKPMIGAGMENPYFRALAFYQLGQGDPHNNVRSLRLEFQVRVGRGVWVTHEQVLTAFHATDQPNVPLNGYEATAGVKYYFGKH